MRRCRWMTLAALLGPILPMDVSVLAQAPGPIGFAPASRSAQVQAEARAIAVPTPDNARSWLRTLTEEPHVAGTPADYQTALFVRDKLRDWGWQADLVEYEVLLNYPVVGVGMRGGTPSLEIVSPTRQILKLVEDPIAVDKDSASPAAFPAFHGYGASGEAAGQIVYANYGRPEDFQALERLGVEVRGKVVLVRYGELFRGLKVREAQRRGAVGVLIYSDPADDGYAKGDVYPEGSYRPPSAIQRGSVQFLSLGPGDPSTPNGPSTKGAPRLAIDPLHGFPIGDEAAVKAWEAASGLVRADYYAAIPSLPIGYEAARPIFEALAGANVPGGWQGGLPLAYHVGPGPVEVSLSVRMDYKVRPIWNVIATLKGSVEPDRWVLVGNHRDAWVYGAVDPGSGTAATLEMCRALGEAVKGGWSPRRTIVYASWDAEEYGLVGSTEWAEEHAEELDAKATLLLNVDVAVAGPDLDLDGVPSLRDLLLEAAGEITDVPTGRTLREVWTDKRRSAWAGSAPIDLDARAWTGDGPFEPMPTPAFSPQLNALGSGSDYTAFLDHLGVPALDVGFTGRYGVYHSIYDDFAWMERFGDPGFVTHAMAARLYTLIAMRAASADILPLRFVPYGEALRDALDDLRRIVERRARAAGAEATRSPIPFEGVADLIGAVRSFQEAAADLDGATVALADRDGIDPARLVRVNDALTRVERAFLLPDGLPGRPWFRHAVYAPGLTTGYASWPLPGVRQAILENNAAMLAAQGAALIDRINAATTALRTATAAAREAIPAAPAPAAGPPPRPPAGTQGR